VANGFVRQPPKFTLHKKAMRFLVLFEKKRPWKSEKPNNKARFLLNPFPILFEFSIKIHGRTISLHGLQSQYSRNEYRAFCPCRLSRRISRSGFSFFFTLNIAKMAPSYKPLCINPDCRRSQRSSESSWGFLMMNIAQDTAYLRVHGKIRCYSQFLRTALNLSTF
jgi:hypothetical protein